MARIRSLNSKVNLKTTTGGDQPANPVSYVTNQYVGVSTASQTVINLSFAVDQNLTKAFLLIVDGKILTPGASNDYQFTSIQANNTSSQGFASNTPTIANYDVKDWDTHNAVTTGAATASFDASAAENHASIELIGT